VSVETALWVLGGAVAPLIGWGCWVTIILTRMARESAQLLRMHERPDDFGFGTARTNRIIEDNTRAMTALTHYIKWLAKDQTGDTPPPPL